MNKSIRVNDFQWNPGKNDGEYIKLLEEARDTWETIAQKAISKLKQQAKAQEPVKPILARGWYWCGGIGCRNSLTSVLENDVPARKPNYCEKCGRAVRWNA